MTSFSISLTCVINRTKQATFRYLPHLEPFLMEHHWPLNESSKPWAWKKPSKRQDEPMETSAFRGWWLMTFFSLKNCLDFLHFLESLDIRVYFAAPRHVWCRFRLCTLLLSTRIKGEWSVVVQELASFGLADDIHTSVIICRINKKLVQYSNDLYYILMSLRVAKTPIWSQIWIYILFEILWYYLFICNDVLTLHWCISHLAVSGRHAGW